MVLGSKGRSYFTPFRTSHEKNLTFHYTGCLSNGARTSQNVCFTHGASRRSFLAYALGPELQIFFIEGQGKIHAGEAPFRIILFEALSAQQRCPGPNCSRSCSSFCQHLCPRGLRSNPLSMQQGGWFASNLPDQFGEAFAALQEP